MKVGCGVPAIHLVVMAGKSQSSDAPRVQARPDGTLRFDREGSHPEVASILAELANLHPALAYVRANRGHPPAVKLKRAFVAEMLEVTPLRVS